MWEKELMEKYKNKYIIKWSVNPSSFLMGIVVERREDEYLTTPKNHSGKDDSRVTSFKYFKHNNETLF